MKIDVSTTVERRAHVPGRNYHDVEVRIRQRRDGWRVNVVEVWGSCQGNDEEHGRNAVAGFGDDLPDAIADAEARARDADINVELLSQAISQARDEVEDELDENAPNLPGDDIGHRLAEIQFPSPEYALLAEVKLEQAADLLKGGGLTTVGQFKSLIARLPDDLLVEHVGDYLAAWKQYRQ